VDNWRCKECRMAFKFSGDPSDNRCPSCGSPSLIRFAVAHDHLEMSLLEHIKLKCKDHCFRRSANSAARLGPGDDLRVRSGRVVDECRVADADLDIYKEKIVDLESGCVIRDVKEPLSGHRGAT
jgi:hypothetical protein